MLDRYERKIDYVRISVTDKCNLRCRYCMPPGGIQHIEHKEILGFEEIYHVCKILAGLGVTKIKFTGGEPLVRKDFITLVKMVKSIDGIKNISITTNGVLLEKMVTDLKTAGVDSINLSLDTLNRKSFENITGVDAFEQVYAGMKKAISERLKVKINCVPAKELNMSDIVNVAHIAKDEPVDVRFIELMPIGCGKQYTGISSEEILEILEKEYGPSKTSYEVHGNGPAKYVDFEGFKGSIGFISPMSHKFCHECNRVRITADGKLKLCLHYKDGIDLKKMLRSDISEEELEKNIAEAIFNKPKAHTFESAGETNVENNKMVQIGG